MTTRIKVVVGQNSWAWDCDVDMETAFAIKRETQLGVMSFHRGVLDRDPDCCQTIVYLCRRVSEPTLKRRDVTFNFGDFDLEDLDDADPTGEPSSQTVTSVTTNNASTNGSSLSPDASVSMQQPYVA